MDKYNLYKQIEALIYQEEFITKINKSAKYYNLYVQRFWIDKYTNQFKALVLYTKKNRVNLELKLNIHDYKTMDEFYKDLKKVLIQIDKMMEKRNGKE